MNFRTSTENVITLGVQYNIGHTVLKWVYSDEIDSKLGDGFMLDVMKTAHRFKLALVEKCEEILIARLDRTNCLRFYKESEEICANTLKSKASQFITSFWEEFTSEDFEAMSAPLMYKFLKSKVDLPLHNAIRLKREDVVFLFLTEYQSQLTAKINERNNEDLCPLALALQTKQIHMAETIVCHGADVNSSDSKGRTLLIKFLLAGKIAVQLNILGNQIII
ncbi:unnamed protein product [Soboliphyme baturini]|uniref:ANK_REP_REGION domain-containing protein n=1 Tax=Soboliphyme baturini TaxID=241478 RepID=A0A183J9N7_9BILA|nr:unnamed protein product [Soboliphyme baturini]